jgi:DoxX-like protein
VKNPKTLYWIVTSLMSALMVLSAIPDLLRIPEAVAIIGHLGYPVYLLPFLGAAKTLGVVAVLVPGFHRVKEWAFAGLVFDVTGALYSHLSVGDPVSGWMPAAIALVLIGGSYLAYRRSHAHPSALQDGTQPIATDRGVARREPGNIAWGN